jgi:general secretion pathway protein G
VAVAVIVVTLLGVVFVAGIVAAIAIPNFLQAVDRGKQKRTLAEIRSIAAAVEAYATDHGLYPTAPDLAALERLLEPRYIRNVARVDGWNHPIEYLPGPGVGYTLRSPGKDGVVETTPVGGPTLDFDCDIVLVNGEFTQWPDGMRR